MGVNMSIIDKLLYQFGYLKAGSASAGQTKYPAHLLASAGAEAWSMPSPGVYENQAKLYAKLSWVYGAISRTAETAALQPLNVKELKGEETEDIPNHDFELLLNDPNPLHSRFEFFTATFSFLALTGNSYWWLNRASEEEPPAEIWIIPSYKIMPEPDNKLYLKGYIYEPGNGEEPVPLPPWQVVHFKSFNPLHEFVGMSAVEPLATTSATDLKAQDWSYRYFGENNARLPGILAFKDIINDPQWNDIKSDVTNAAKMRNFLMLRGVGDNVNWIQAAASQKDMQYIEQRDFTKNEIYSIYAPGYASMVDVNATEANSLAGKQTFLEFGIWPRLVAVAQKITKGILRAYGEKLVAEFDDPRQVDRTLELEEQKLYAISHTINEIRQKYYEDDELEDDRGLLLPAQVGLLQIPVEWVTGEEPEPVPTPLLQGPVADPNAVPGIEEEPFEPEEGGSPPAQPEMPGEVRADLRRWHHHALNALKKKKPAATTFTSNKIPPALGAAIGEALKGAQNAAEVNAIFRNAWIGYP